MLPQHRPARSRIPRSKFSLRFSPSRSLPPSLPPSSSSISPCVCGVFVCVRALERGREGKGECREREGERTDGRVVVVHSHSLSLFHALNALTHALTHSLTHSLHSPHSLTPSLSLSHPQNPTATDDFESRFLSYRALTRASLPLPPFRNLGEPQRELLNFTTPTDHFR